MVARSGRSGDGRGWRRMRFSLVFAHGICGSLGDAGQDAQGNWEVGFVCR
jgi:hypothetical protein